MGVGRGALLLIAPSALELAGGVANSGLRRESQGSLNSSASLDLGFLAFVSSKSEVSRLLGEMRGGLGPLLRPLCVAAISPGHCIHFSLPACPPWTTPQPPYFLPVLTTLGPICVTGAHPLQQMCVQGWLPRGTQHVYGSQWVDLSLGAHMPG